MICPFRKITLSPVSKMDWRESQTGSLENDWESLSVGRSRVDDLCQPVTVGIDSISRIDIRKAKLI